MPALLKGRGRRILKIEIRFSKGGSKDVLILRWLVSGSQPSLLLSSHALIY